MHTHQLRRGLALMALLTLFACGDQDGPTQPDVDAPSPLLAVNDGSNGGNPGVFFLPPLRPKVTLPGTFDASVPLRMEVRLKRGTDELALEHFSVAAGGIAVDGDHYSLLWSVPTGALEGDVIGITAYAASLLLGHLDVHIAGSGQEMVQIRQGDNAAVMDVPRALPIHLFLNGEAVGYAEDAAAAEIEAELEQEFGVGTIQEVEVVVVDNGTGGQVTVEDDPDNPTTGGTVTTFANQAFVEEPDGTLEPAGDYVLSAALVSNGASGGLPLSQQGGPFLIVEAQTADGRDVFFGQATVDGVTYDGANVCLTQPQEIHNTYSPAQVAAQDAFRDDNGVFSFHDTQFGSCPSDAVGGTGFLQQAARNLTGWRDALTLGRRSLVRVAAYFLPTPLRATHGGLTTLPSDGFDGFSGVGAILRTIPAASTADVPQTGVVGAPTVITIQANAVDANGTPVPQANGDDSVRVVVSQANSATLTVANGGVVDNTDGTYTATYTPQNAGTDQIDISILNIETGDFEAISGSPFTSEVAPPPPPDLVVSSVGTVAVSGTDVSVDATLSNLGGPAPEFPASSTWDVAVYLSTDVVFDASDTHLTSMYTAWTYPVGTGWSASSTLSGSLPDATAPGQYYLIVVADAFPNQPPNNYPGVEESDETNNWTASPAFTVGSPDLQVSVFTAPATAQLDDAIGADVFLEITNIGTADIPAETSVSIGFYISTDQNITTADRLLQGGRENLYPDALAAGASIVIPLFAGANVSSTVPDENPPLGDVFIGVVLDEFDDLTELDESNNTASQDIEITSPPGE